MARDPIDPVELVALGAAGVTVVGGLGAAVAFARDSSPQLQGGLLGVAFLAFALALGLWAVRAMPGGTAVEEREPLASAPADRRAAVAGFERGERVLGRRGVLISMLGLGAATIGGALLVPIRAPGPNPGASCCGRRGGARRLVTDDGAATGSARVTLAVDGVLTVFPGGRPVPRRRPDPADPPARRRRPAPRRPSGLERAGLRGLLQGVHPRGVPCRALRGRQPPLWCAPATSRCSR
ncbi:MAG: hypothetical protein R2746_03360 [Acidimicrobiales bacterium]